MTDGLLRIHGRLYGTRRAIAATLGPDITIDMIRNWARTDRQIRCPHCRDLDLTTTPRPCDHPLRLTSITAGGRTYDEWHSTPNRDAYVGVAMGRAGRAADQPEPSDV